MTETIAYFTQLPFWELIAVASALIYVVLAAKENIWCWPAALISTVIYTVIFYDVYLWMESLLQVYYFAMAIYGWYCWYYINKRPQKTLYIQSWSLSFHVKAILLLSIISMVVGLLMATNTPTHYPYLDSATTVFSVFTTYLVAQKVLENWLYWIVINAVSVYLYLAKDLEPTAALLVLYFFMALYGYFQWSTKFKQRKQNEVLTETSTAQP
ncbi:nicotinamide riboside transporter PnuC [Thalassotalea castellviae]|uniref:Nicotinamide riboside transporter PnuC n=1 Tax=Thalassotalea castellviae TaxID=3075612 RepID=A0ABU3A1N0_9GAMM|nr:nicotinamide riboside transporter PnuC [Thalassotalea sp. W431]MDT0604088.1 nicotinamide riboside transporter PnuC [Thalassotalea sp. W431]